jgi:thioredoxin
VSKTALRSLTLLFLLTAFRPTPAQEILLGRVGVEAILSISPEWRTNREAYDPAEADIRVIASSPVAARLDVYFGSWCSDSRREVPRFLKILDRASPVRVKVRFYGLDRTKKEPARLARRGAIERVPTFILSVGGREVGRIVESPRTTLEHDLALLFEKAAVPPR